MSKRTKMIISGLLATSMMAGCSVSHETTGKIRGDTKTATAMLPEASQPMPAALKKPVNVNSGVFVGSKSIRNENGDPLPSKYESKTGIVINKGGSSLSLREIASIITENTKIPLTLASNAAIGASGGGSAAPAVEAAPTMAAGPIPEGFPLGEALSQISGGRGGGTITASRDDISSERMPVSYSGPLSGLLDIMSAHFNIAWRYDKGGIILDRVITRSFDVPALSMESNLSFDLTSKSSQAGEGGNDNSAGQTAKSTAATNVLSEMTDGLKGLVSDGDGSFSVNKATGVVTVTASPSTVNRVSNYISTINARLSEQVALSIKVYSVSLNDGEEFDLDVKGMFNKAGKYGVALGTAGSGGVVPSTGPGPGLGWALLDPNSNWAGSNALVKALATRGDVSVVTTASVTTVSGIPVPLQVGEERDFVKSVEVTTNENSSTASITPGTVSTGFSLQVNPRVERNGDVLVQYGINISELTGSEDGFETYETLGTTVQLRRINQRNFIQQARIPSDSTLVLAGFEQVRNESQKSGVGKANFPLFGGGSKSNMKREIIVIAITPTVLKSK